MKPKIIICPNETKNYKLKHTTDYTQNIKYLTLSEVYKSIYFTYDQKAVYHIMNKYHIKCEVAQIYLKNLHYIEDKDYQNNKLNKLVAIKKTLEAEKLLIYDKYFPKLLQGKEIIIEGYPYLTEEDHKLINNLQKYTTVKVNDPQSPKYTPTTLYTFNTPEDELAFVATNICKLIKEGTPLQNIIITNLPDNYKIKMQRIMNFFNIKTSMTSEVTLYDIPEVKKYLQTFNLSDIKDTLVKSKVVNILNNYTWSSPKEVQELLINDFKTTSYTPQKYKNTIQVVNLNTYVPQDEDHVFLLSFNTDNIPTIHKDEEYITDNIASKVGKSTTTKLNKLEKEATINKIKSIKNLIITNKKKDGTTESYPSVLTSILSLETKYPNEDYTYSNTYNNLKLASKLDTYIKYSEKTIGLIPLLSHYKNINYLTYNNTFTKVPYHQDNLTLSYTTVDTYNKCAFRYYINNVLKLSIYEDTFMTYIGSLYHYVLSQAFTENFAFDKEYEDYIHSNTRTLTAKELHFINKLKDELKYIIKIINKQYTYTTFNKALYEEEITIPLAENVTFKGIIDKLLYKEEENETLVAIIDYKTGNLKLNLNNIIYGLSLQLPVYLYLTKHGTKLKNPLIVGFYLQKILHNEISRSDKKTYQELKEESLKLGGYSLNKENILEKFDTSYNNSKVVASLKTTNKGFYHYSKVLSEEQINKIIDITEQKILEVKDNIQAGHFQINPKKIGKNNLGCEYCQYKDICFMRPEDIINLEEHTNLDFLDQN